jgi:hypothetical protein
MRPKRAGVGEAKGREKMGSKGKERQEERRRRRIGESKLRG